MTNNVKEKEEPFLWTIKSRSWQEQVIQDLLSKVILTRVADGWEIKISWYKVVFWNLPINSEQL